MQKVIKLRQIGNSYGFIIYKKLLDQFDWSGGATVEVIDGKIVITPMKGEKNGRV